MNFNCKCHLAFKLKSYHGQNNPFVIQQVITFNLCNLYTLFNVCVDVIISMDCDFDFHSFYVPLFVRSPYLCQLCRKYSLEIYSDWMCSSCDQKKQRLKRIFFEMYRMCLISPKSIPFSTSACFYHYFLRFFFKIFCAWVKYSIYVRKCNSVRLFLVCTRDIQFMNVSFQNA